MKHLPKRYRLAELTRLIYNIYNELPSQEKNGKELYNFEIPRPFGIIVGDEVQIELGLVSVIDEKCDGKIICTLLLDTSKEMQEIIKRNGLNYSDNLRNLVPLRPEDFPSKDKVYGRTAKCYFNRHNIKDNDEGILGVLYARRNSRKTH